MDIAEGLPGRGVGSGHSFSGNRKTLPVIVSFTYRRPSAPKAMPFVNLIPESMQWIEESLCIDAENAAVV